MKITYQFNESKDDSKKEVKKGVKKNDFTKDRIHPIDTPEFNTATGWPEGGIGKGVMRIPNDSPSFEGSYWFHSQNFNDEETNKRPLHPEKDYYNPQDSHTGDDYVEIRGVHHPTEKVSHETNCNADSENYDEEGKLDIEKKNAGHLMGQSKKSPELKTYNATIRKNADMFTVKEESKHIYKENQNTMKSSMQEQLDRIKQMMLFEDGMTYKDVKLLTEEETGGDTGGDTGTDSGVGTGGDTGGDTGEGGTAPPPPWDWAPEDTGGDDGEDTGEDTGGDDGEDTGGDDGKDDDDYVPGDGDGDGDGDDSTKEKGDDSKSSKSSKSSKGSPRPAYDAGSYSAGFDVTTVSNPFGGGGKGIGSMKDLGDGELQALIAQLKAQLKGGKKEDKKKDELSESRNPRKKSISKKSLGGGRTNRPKYRVLNEQSTEISKKAEEDLKESRNPRKNVIKLTEADLYKIVDRVLNEKKKDKDWMQKADADIERRGTEDDFHDWCKRKKKLEGGKVTCRCVKFGKRSGDNKIIKQATLAGNYPTVNKGCKSCCEVD